MRTFDEIRALLAQKFSKEKKRLRSYKTPYASFDLANAVARYVQNFMAESRYRELKNLRQFIEKHHIDVGKRLNAYIMERSKATKLMAKALENEAVATESKRPWKYKKDKKKKYESHRRSRSSRG